METFYAKSTGGFYRDDIHTASQIPTDAVEITEAQYLGLMDAQAQGKEIQANEAGFPVAGDHIDTPADITARLKGQAQAALEKSDVNILRMYEAGVPVPVAWRDYRVSLRAIVSGASEAVVLPATPAYVAGT